MRTAGQEEEYRVRLDDLVRDGDISANVAMRPGDVVIIPESYFLVRAAPARPQCGMRGGASEGGRVAAQRWSSLIARCRASRWRHLQPMGAQIEDPQRDAAARARLVR